MSKPWFEYPGAFDYWRERYGRGPNEPSSIKEALLLLERIERKQLKKQLKKEEEEKKKKEADKKKSNMPTFDVWQLMVLGPIVGFSYLYIFNIVLQKTAEILHVH